MDELSAVQRLLAEPPPGPDVVEAARLKLEHAALGRTPLRTRAAGRGWRAPALVRRAAAPRRWPGWLAPVAAAAAVAGAIIASLAISGVILRPAGTGPANSGVFAKVPPVLRRPSRDPRPRGGRRDRHRGCAGDRRAAQAVQGVHVGGSRW